MGASDNKNGFFFLREQNVSEFTNAFNFGFGFNGAQNLATLRINYFFSRGASVEGVGFCFISELVKT